MNGLYSPIVIFSLWALGRFVMQQSLGKEMATHSSVLALRIPGTGEPGGLLSVYGVTQSRTRLK